MKRINTDGFNVLDKACIRNICDRTGLRKQSTLNRILIRLNSLIVLQNDLFGCSQKSQQLE